MTPQELQRLLGELEASRRSRRRAWENLQEIRWERPERRSRFQGSIFGFLNGENLKVRTRVIEDFRPLVIHSASICDSFRRKSLKMRHAARI